MNEWLDDLFDICVAENIGEVVQKALSNFIQTLCFAPFPLH